MGKLNIYSGDPIITGIWPNGSYSDCDISSIVGEQCVVAYLRVGKTIAGTAYCAVRTKGDTDSVYNGGATSGHRGIHSTEIRTSNLLSGIIAITNNYGIFEYTGNGIEAEARLLCWFIPTSNEIIDLLNGVMPTSWTNIGNNTINNKALMFLKYKTLATSDKIAIRPDDDTDNYLLPVAQCRGGGSTRFGDHNIANLAEFGAIPSIPNKLKFEHISDNGLGGPSNVDLDIIAYENDSYISINKRILTVTTRPIPWNEVDLSSYIGSREALVILKCGRPGGVSGGYFGVRPYNESKYWFNDSATSAGNGCNQCQLSVDTYAIMIVPTNSSKLEFYWTNSADTKTVDLIGYLPEDTTIYGSTIRDYWFNNLSTPVSISVLGYREADEEFPHDIYSYFLSSIREDDIKKTRLFYRWLYGMQQIWESMYAKILALPDLYSPDNCPAEFLEYLKDNVGITDNLNNLWGVLTENEKRRLIKYFVYYIQYKGTRVGIIDIIKSMTGRDVELLSYFDMRWILSGNTSEDSDLETAIGREDLGYDPHLLSEYNVKQNYTPDAVAITPISGENFYEFTIDSLISDTLDDNPPVPSLVRLTYIPTKVTLLTSIYNDGNWKTRAPADYYFDQSTPYSTSIDKFHVGFDLDAYIFDLKVVDDGTINREMIIELVKFSRPSSEKIYIRYYTMIDNFTDVYTNQWDVISGVLTHDSDDNEITLNGSTDTIIQNNLDDADIWTDYCVAVKARSTIAEKYFEIRTMVQDSDNYLYLRVEPNTVPHIPAGTWVVGEVVVGIDTQYTTGNFDWFDLNIDYFWRMVCVVSQSNIIIQCYCDENLFYNGSVSNTFTDMKGRIELMQEADGESVITHMEVHPFPMESDFVST